MPDNPKPDISDLEHALALARNMAQEKIQAIDKMHDRSVRYIAAVLRAGALLASGLTSLGYQNLKSLAISVATQNVKNETTRQVRDHVTEQNLKGMGELRKLRQTT